MLDLINLKTETTAETETDKIQPGILTRTDRGWQGQMWQQLLSNSYPSLAQLLARLELPGNILPGQFHAMEDFKLCVPEPFLKRMEKGNPQDPLLLQVLPLSEEMKPVPGFSNDPLAEKRFNPQRGIVHKYQGRVLLMVNGVCAVNCRYCFRRHFPYSEHQNNKQQWRESLESISDNPGIHEVILSGGDPLVCNDKQLDWLITELENIPHLKRLRIHTRLPIVIPQRMTETLLDRLASSRLPCCLVVHCNHPVEIDEDVAYTLQCIAKRGITLLNQTVLLKAVNDHADTQIQLAEKLYQNRCLPYYLHLLDKVSGAAHFDVGMDKALAIYQTMKARLPGYLLPRMVREEAGENAKTPIIP